MNTPIIIAGMLCATVIILCIIACIHDTIKTTANARSMRKFETAFKDFQINNAANDAHKVTTIEGAEPLDFPNGHVETRPQKYR